MKLNETTILLIKQKKELKLLLALELGVSESTINRALSANRPNGILTTVGAVKLISKQLNIKPKDVFLQSSNKAS